MPHKWNVTTYVAQWVIEETRRDMVKWKKHRTNTIVLDAFASEITIGIDHLAERNWSPIDEIANADKTWTAMHWMQSTHQYERRQLRIPKEGTACLMKETSWGDNKCTCASKWSSFSVNGLLAVRLTNTIEKFIEPSDIRTIWENFPNPGDKARLSAHFLEALSGLLIIFTEWGNNHSRGSDALQRYDTIYDRTYGAVSKTRENVFIV